MASAALGEHSRPGLIPAATIRTVRAATGAVLFAYILTHLINHAVGIVSLDALEAGRAVFLAIWRNPVGTLLLYGSFLIHGSLAFHSLYRKRSLRMPGWEAAQLLLGLAIPPLLWEHLVGTRIASSLLGSTDDYAHTLAILWNLQPAAGLRQVATLSIAWLHGCIGLHYWLRLKSWYAPALPWTYGAALLVPILALIGSAAGGREVAALLADEAERAALLAGFPARDEIGRLTAIYNAGLAFYFTALGGTFAARLVRIRIERRHAVTVSYPDGRRIEVGRGTTLLEASRAAGVPHASVCGGRGRCSTCRVRVVRGQDHLPPPSEDELRVLQRLGAGPGTRLACQTRPTGPVEIVPLLPPHAGPSDARGRPAYLHGAEQEIAILFCDLRAFTNLAEHRLPFDLVFLLNRFFRAMGEAVEEAGGRVDKFIGDGVMALFGIGIHTGPAIIWEMGYGRATGLTAIGDAVNAASRLESLTKEFACQLVVSQAVAERAGLALEEHPTREVTLRGRREPIIVRIVLDAARLPPA